VLSQTEKMKTIDSSVLLTIIILLLTYLVVPACASEQPSSPKNLFPPQQSEQVRVLPGSGSPSSVQKAMAYIQDQQRSLYRKLAGSLRAVKSEYSTGTVTTLIVLSFLYGIFHAVGPGHGKAVISSYLLANERAIKRGIGLSFAASLAQAVSAVFLVTAIIFLLKHIGITTRQSALSLEVFSAVFIALIGGWMLWSSLRALGSGSSDRGCVVHSHHVHLPDDSHPLSWSTAGAIIAAVGLRPCSGAIFVLLFANTIGLYVAGIWSTFAMAVGTAVTVSILAMITLGSKEVALRIAGFKPRWIDTAYATMRIFGSFVVLGVGLLLIVSALSPATPLPFR